MLNFAVKVIQIPQEMDLGALVFLLIAVMAFWMLIFLFGVAVPMWITEYVKRGMASLVGKKPETPDHNEISA